MLRSALSLVVLVLLGCQQGEDSPRLRQLDRSLSILADPKRLLDLASSYVGPPGQPNEHPFAPTIETRHEAVLALLRQQSSRFHTALASVKETTGIDHVVVEPLPSADGLVRLLATPSRFADRKAPEGDYWSMEVLEFDMAGRLLSRQAYTVQ